MTNPTTMLVKPWAEGQGDSVIINADDFDPAFHTPIKGQKVPKRAAVNPVEPPADESPTDDAVPADDAA